MDQRNGRGWYLGSLVAVLGLAWSSHASAFTGQIRAFMSTIDGGGQDGVVLCQPDDNVNGQHCIPSGVPALPATEIPVPGIGVLKTGSEFETVVRVTQPSDNPLALNFWTADLRDPGAQSKTTIDLTTVPGFFFFPGDEIAPLGLSALAAPQLALGYFDYVSVAIRVGDHVGVVIFGPNSQISSYVDLPNESADDFRGLAIVRIQPENGSNLALELAVLSRPSQGLDIGKEIVAEYDLDGNQLERTELVLGFNAQSTVVGFGIDQWYVGPERSFLVFASTTPGTAGLSVYDKQSGNLTETDDFDFDLPGRADGFGMLVTLCDIDNYAPVTYPCTLGLCAPFTSSSFCYASAVPGRGAILDESCQPPFPFPTPSLPFGSSTDATCDGIDDDCDGQLDEDFESEDHSCNACSNGQTSCVNGVVKDPCASVCTPTPVAGGWDFLGFAWDFDVANDKLCAVVHENLGNVLDGGVGCTLYAGSLSPGLFDGVQADSDFSPTGDSRLSLDPVGRLWVSTQNGIYTTKNASPILTQVAALPAGCTRVTALELGGPVRRRSHLYRQRSLCWARGLICPRNSSRV